MDRLTSMAVFVKAAELGSFAATATAMDLSPQMVAKHVAYLENRLGTTLLNRTTRRQSLTAIGSRYYERCKVILSETDSAETLAREMQIQPKGVLRVTAPVIFGSTALAPLVTQYLAQHPEVEVELVLTDRRVEPLEEGFEVIIRVGEVRDSNLVAVPLKPYRIIACAAPAYLKTHGVPTVPAHLTEHECLAYMYGTPSIFSHWQFTCNKKTEEVAVKGRLRSNDWPSLLAAVIGGNGIILGPEYLLSNIIKAGHLIRVLPDYEGQARPMHVLFPAGRPSTAKIRSFVEAVITAFGS